MVYEIKVTQTVSGTIYVEGDNYEDAEKNARQFIKKDPKHVASIIFNETWVTEARDRRLVEVRLRQTSDFEPDFAKGKGGWVVCYDYLNKKIDCFDSIWNDSGEPVRYATEEEAKKSIKENEADWKKYFGIKEEN